MTIVERQIRDRAIDARRDELLTIAEFAAMLRVHHQTIRRRIRRAQLPGAAKVGGQWRIDVAVALPRK